MTECPVCNQTVAVLANAAEVVTYQSEHGTYRLLHYVCPECLSVPPAVRVSRDVAALAVGLMQARPEFERLRVDAECRDILTREGLT